MFPMLLLESRLSFYNATYNLASPQLVNCGVLYIVYSSKRPKPWLLPFFPSLSYGSSPHPGLLPPPSSYLILSNHHNFNFRPNQPLNSRTVRTNIAFPGDNSQSSSNNLKSDYSEVDSECPEAFREMFYQANAFTEPVKSSP